MSDCDKCERCGLLKGEGGCEADTEAAWRESPLGSRLRCRDREITTHRKRITELEAALAERDRRVAELEAELAGTRLQVESRDAALCRMFSAADLAERRAPGVTLLPQRPQDGDDGSGNSQDPQGEP